MEETLGKRIAAHRKRLALTQDALAEQLGVTAQAVSKWENDQSCPDISMLPKLAEVFDITIDEVLGVPSKEGHITENSTQEQVSPEPEKTAEQGGIWNALRSPAAAFAFWLFLTGLVALIDAIRPYPCDLTDIVIACGIFTFGLFSLFHRFSLLRLGCTLAGGAFVLNLVTEPGIVDMDWFVPLAAGIALLGLDLLIDTIRKPKGSWKNMPDGHIPEDAIKNICTYDGKRFHCSTRFGENDRLIQLPLLSGGSGDVTFGELTLDLSGCAEITHGCSIDLNCTFGSLNVLIPRKYRVETASHSAFGTVEEKGVADPGSETTIYLSCSVRFGEITVRHI